ncbi:MAG: NifU N-terminal domain-containing protein [Dehalococcoidia bacterium]
MFPTDYMLAPRQGAKEEQPVVDAITVQAETTPNPESMKFTVNRVINTGAPQTFSSPDQAFLSPLARALFAVPGVTGVFFLKDFVTIRRAAGTDWSAVTHGVEAALRGYFDRGDER